MMERLEKFQIIFNNPSATYYAGETVYGYGWIMLREAMFVQTCCLEAVGEATVEWLTSSDIQASDEEVFSYTTILPLKGTKDIADEALLHAGSHYFPFEFTLPQRLPTSFKGKHGRLRYFVRMTICTPGGPHHERRSKFSVLSALDLNAEPDAALPVENDTFEQIGSWCFISGTVTASLKLDRKGYTLKEAVPVWAQIKNLSTRRISSTQVSLIQYISWHTLTSLGKHRWVPTPPVCVENVCISKEHVTYYSYRGRFSEKTVLVTIHKGGIAPRGKQTWQRELLSIPTVPPSHLRGCKIIDIQYTLELIIKPSGLARKIKLPVDIVIGTIPLEDVAGRRPVSYHLLPSPSDSLFPYHPFCCDTASDQVFLTDPPLHPHMLPTAPPWEEEGERP